MQKLQSAFIKLMLTYWKGTIKNLRRLTDVKADCWSAWFVRPTSEQTCSFQCEKEKKKKYRVKKTIGPVSLNGCQPSVSGTWAQTKQLSPCWREKTHRYGGRGRSKASVT